MNIHSAPIKSKPEHAEAFQIRLLERAHNSITSEETCHHFDAYQASEDPTLFWLVEFYDDDAALKSHQGSNHVREFRADTAGLIESRAWWFWQEPKTAPAPDVK